MKPGPIQTVCRHLKKLETVGMARKESNGTWVALERDLDQVAAELGVLGKGQEQAARHASDSQKFITHLKMREEEEDRAFRELEDAGHVWVGRYKNFLVPPDRGSQKKRKQTTPVASRRRA